MVWRRAEVSGATAVAGLVGVLFRLVLCEEAIHLGSPVAPVTFGKVTSLGN